MAFEAADDLLLGLALLGAPGYVGSGALLVAHAAQSDYIEGSVGIAVAVTVEAVADGLARRGRYRGIPAQVREGHLVLESLRVITGGDQQRGGRIGANALHATSSSGAASATRRSSCSS